MHDGGAPQETPAPASAEVVERRLPSGRALVLRIDGGGEEIEIRSARGEVDVRITLTDAGPVVTLRGARLEMESPDVAVRCRTFDVQATEALRLGSGGGVRIEADEVRAETKQDIHLNGAFIRLNCTADAPSPEEMMAQMQRLMTGAPEPAPPRGGVSADPAVDPGHPAYDGGSAPKPPAHDGGSAPKPPP